VRKTVIRRGAIARRLAPIGRIAARLEGAVRLLGIRHVFASLRVQASYSVLLGGSVAGDERVVVLARLGRRAESVGGVERVEVWVDGERIGFVDHRWVDQSLEEGALAGMRCEEDASVGKRHRGVGQRNRSAGWRCGEALTRRQSGLLAVEGGEGATAGVAERVDVETVVTQENMAGGEVDDRLLVQEVEVVVR
jgi:hypothetical protein